MYHVICFGEILWDNFKEGKKAGGAPMNVALHLHKQGIDSKLISSVGNDNNGTELLHFLKEQGLPDDYIQKHLTLPTGIVEVELDEKQQAKYTITAPVAWDEIAFEERLEQAVEKSDALIFGSLASRNEISRATLLRLLPSAQFRVFDMNLRPPHFDNKTLKDLIGQCDLLKINEDELLYLEKLYKLAEGNVHDKLVHLSRLLNIGTICVTLGDKGAMVINSEQIYQHPGFIVDVADTVGAGDAFLATFINNLLQNLPMEKVLERACAAGAIVASKAGANPQYSAEQLDNIQLRRKDGA